ncbi:GD23931 [Drosophila simulans]|uniref:GD23931 n=1 Tax=Drosophila simulans TaxID=7240 RepID=B4Q575_DROSI|nr:GD23931 [Drosophila simulans]
MSNYHPHSHPHALSHPHPQQVHNQLQNPHQNQLPPPQRHNHVASTAAASASGAPSSSASASASILVAHPPQPLISNSLAIRQEIQRFESVHPSIYAIYELIDLLPMADAQIAQSIRDHVVCIEV